MNWISVEENTPNFNEGNYIDEYKSRKYLQTPYEISFRKTNT